jgi:hypothetical protein
MNVRKAIFAAMFSIAMIGVGAGPGEAADGILLKVTAGDSNYCHMKFPAIREDTLSWDRPVLKDSSTGDVIDFYGPCDYDPTGKAAVQAQRLDRKHRFSHAYGE